MSEVLYLPPESLIVDPDKNGRAFTYTTSDYSDLLQDIADGRGIKEPVSIIDLSDGRFELTKGYRRYGASLHWNRLHPDSPVLLQALIVPTVSDMERLIQNIRENIARKTLTPIDLGDVAEKLLAFGNKVPDVARVLGVSEAQVTQHLKLVRDLPENVQELIHRGTLTADEGFTLIKTPPARRQEVLETYLAGIASRMIASEEVESGPPPSPSDKGEPKVTRVKDDTPASRPLREIAKEAGADVGAMRMPEFKKYLNLDIEMEGPGSHKGVVEIKKQLMKLLANEITTKEMDAKFERICKERT